MNNNKQNRKRKRHYDHIINVNEQQLTQHGNPFMPDGYRRILIVGSSFTGKTRSLCKILPLIGTPKKVFFYVPSGLDNDIYKAIIEYYKKIRNVEIFELEKLEAIDDLLKDESLEEYDHNLIILDDLTKEDLESQTLFNLITRGRHRHLNIIIITQNYFAVPPGVRNNMTEMGLFPCDQPDQIYHKSPIKQHFDNNLQKFLSTYKDATAWNENGDRDWLHVILDNSCPKSMIIRKGMKQMLTDFDDEGTNVKKMNLNDEIIKKIN